MSKLHDLKNRGYVGLDVSPITNSLIDHAKGETVSIVGTGHNYTNLNGRALRFGAGSSLTVSDNTAQRLDGDGWLVVAGEFNKHGGVAQRYISKRDAGGTNYELYQPSKTEFRVYDGTTESIFTLSSAVDAKVIAVHFSGVGQRPKLYLDGVYSALGSANVTLIGDDALVYLGNVYLGTLVNKNAFTRFIVINDGINVTAQDIAELSQEFIAERGVLHQPRRGYVGTPPKINDASCLLHFDGTKSGSVIPDLTGNGYNATSSTHFSVQSPYGESYGGPRTASIASNTAFLTGSFSFVSWVKIPNITVTSCLFSRDSQPIYIGIDTSENILVSFKDGGSVQRLQTSTTALPIDRWVRMGVSFNVNGSDVTTRFYIDGQFINERVQSTGFFVDPARVVFYGGLTASANLVDGSYTDTAYYNEVKNDAWFASDYGKQATKLAFSHDMKDTPPTLANVTAGQIGETEFTVSTGTWKVSEERDGGGVQLLADGDMEAGDTSAWSADNATLSKETGTRTGGSGSSVLRITTTGATGSAYQGVITNGKKYKITGWARSVDGTNAPRVGLGGASGDFFWTGTTSTDWQEISVEKVASGGNGNLTLNSANSGSVIEFDDVVVQEYGDGNRYIENVVAGVAYTKQDKAYGTWVCEYNKAGAGTSGYFGIIADTVGTYNATGQDGYWFSYDSDEKIQLGESTNGAWSLKFNTAASYFSLSTSYKFAVTRDYTGKFTVYIKGGTFTKWTEVDESGGSGTNPVTDDTTTTSKYLIADLDAGDKARFLGVHEGVLTISDLENLY